MRFNKTLGCALWLVVGLALAAGPVSAALTPDVQETLGQLERFSDAFAAVAAEVQPAVVTISSEKVERVQNPLANSPFHNDPFFRRFFQMPEPRGERRSQGLGSGVIVSGDGYILTNNHVVEGADKIQVELADRRTFDARIVGTDPKSDLAVLQIEASGLPTVPFGDSDQIKVGQWVLALGNPFGLQHTVTYGIVSAIGRGNLRLADYEDFIQTDAAINPGNSGGAMVNLKGELIGINTAIVSRSGGYQGIGFAIPVNMARGIMSQLIETGRVTRGYLGVQIQPVDEEMAEALGVDPRQGVLVSEVQSGTAAEKAGIENGDVIVKVNGEPVDGVAGLRNRISQTPPGTSVDVTVVRKGKQKTLKVKLGELEADEAASAPASRQHEKLGWEVQGLTPELADRLGYEGYKGVVISDIQPGGPGDRKGLRRGDLIVEVNKRPVTSVDEYDNAVSRVGAGEVLLLVVRRGTQSFFVAIRMPE